MEPVEVIRTYVLGTRDASPIAEVTVGRDPGVVGRGRVTERGDDLENVAGLAAEKGMLVSVLWGGAYYGIG